MSFPNRALLAAPLGRDLIAEFRANDLSVRPVGCYGVALAPGVSNAAYQCWDTLDQDWWTALADPDILVCPDLPTLRQKAPAIFAKAVQAARSDSGTQQLNVAFKRISDMTAADFWRVITSTGATVVRNGQPVAGDVRPAGVYRTAWCLVHEWAGSIADTLGN